MSVPARYDRAALERIIQRAAELQTGDRDIGEGLTADEVIQLGREVGIPEAQLRQALLEEQARPPLPPPTSWLDDTAGPAVVTARRVVRGPADELEQRLIRWMDAEEVLVVQRHTAGRITWEPLGGWQAALRRSSRTMSRGAQAITLDQTSQVAATILALEPGFCLVTLTADLGRRRARATAGAAAVLLAGGGSFLMLSALGAVWPLALVGVPVAAVVGWSVLRGYRPVAERAVIGLERALDHLERHGGAPPPPARDGFVGLLAREVRKAIES